MPADLRDRLMVIGDEVGLEQGIPEVLTASRIVE
jgi:hypothetical protein